MDNEPTLRFRWNDHVPHLSKVFSEQRIDEQYCNTSLVTDDGYIIKVHGIILTMTSGYFERILRNVSQDQHPIIVLNGVNYSELICVIDYIYQGLTRVDERLMASVLDLADILEIKGLSKMKNNMSVKKLIAPSNPLSILPHLHCNPKIIASISSLSQNSDNHTLKSDSEDTSSLEKERRDYEVALDRNIVCMKDLKERYHQISENLEDHSQISENVNLSEQAEESMDQTLGIDLSLSKSGSSVVINKDNGKSFNFYEDGSLRKRKCNLENSDNFRNISNDVDFGKIGDKVEIDVLYKQKKLFGKSPDDEERNSFCRRSYRAPLYSKNRRKLIGKAKPGGLTSPATEVEKKNIEYFSFSESEEEFPEIKRNQSTFDAGSTDDNFKRSRSPAEDDMFNMAKTLTNKEEFLHRATETLDNRENKNIQSRDFLHDKHVNFINFNPIPIIRPAFYESRCANQGFESCSNKNVIESNYCLDSFSIPSFAEYKSSTAHKSVDRENYGRPVILSLVNATGGVNSIKSGPINLSSSYPASYITVRGTNNDSCSAVPQVNIFSNDTENVWTNTSFVKKIPSASTTGVARIKTFKSGNEVMNDIDPPTINLSEMIKVHVNNLSQCQGHPSSDKVKEIFEVLDCKKPKSQVKRPLNKFNLYVKSMLPSISSQYTNQQKISLISQMWNSLNSDEKQIWAEKAKEMKTEFFKRNPGFKFHSEISKFQKEEYKRKKLAKHYLFLPNSSRQ